MRAPIAFVALAISLCAPAIAAAQVTRVRPPRRPRQRLIRLAVSGGGQVTRTSVPQPIHTVINAENTLINARFTLPLSPLVDVGSSVQIHRRWAAGASASYLMRDGTGSVSADVPHPFFFGQPRAVSGTVGGLQNREAALHVDAIYVMPLRRTWDLAFFGGPSAMLVQQDLVTGVRLHESYPYDTATFAAASTERISKTQIGYNAGADLTIKLARKVGVGGMVRFTHASLDLHTSDGNRVNLRAGGLQAAGGIRFAF